MRQPFGKGSRPKFNLQATLGYLFPQKRIAPLHFIKAPYKIGVLLRSAFGIALNQPSDGVPVQGLVIRLFLCNSSLAKVIKIYIFVGNEVRNCRYQQ
ncbi:MAG: hypothetical protein ACK552_26245, partial [Microcystis sp.]